MRIFEWSGLPDFRRPIMALVVATASAASLAASPNPTVTVVNTPANPVPVTGTVTGQITGTVKIDATGNTVKATQNGPWGVTVNDPVTVEPGTNPLEVTVTGGALSQSADDIVVLARSLSGWARILPNGSLVDDFAVPAGKLLVVTDFEWVTADITANNSTDRVGEYLTFFAKLGGHQVFRSTARVGDNDVAGAQDHLATGIPMSSVANFVTEFDFSGLVAPPLNEAAAVTVRGHLVPAN